LTPHDLIRIRRLVTKPSTTAANGYPLPCYYPGHTIVNGYPWKALITPIYHLWHCTAEHAGGYCKGNSQRETRWTPCEM